MFEVKKYLNIMSYDDTNVGEIVILPFVISVVETMNNDTNGQLETRKNVLMNFFNITQSIEEQRVITDELTFPYLSDESVQIAMGLNMNMISAEDIEDELTEFLDILAEDRRRTKNTLTTLDIGFNTLKSVIVRCLDNPEDVVAEVEASDAEIKYLDPDDDSVNMVIKDMNNNPVKLSEEEKTNIGDTVKDVIDGFKKVYKKNDEKLTKDLLTDIKKTIESAIINRLSNNRQVGEITIGDALVDTIWNMQDEQD